jgi:ABC-type multidrug transport system fused ATPase/permease subunit
MSPQNDENGILPAPSKLSEMMRVLVPYKRRWIIGLFASFIGMGLYVQIPLCFQQIIKGVTAGDPQIILAGFLWLMTVISIDAVGLYFRFRYGYFYIYSNLIRDLRTRVVDKVLRHSYRFIDHHRSGDLLATATNDVYTTADFFGMQFQNIFTYSLQLVTITAILYVLSPPLLGTLFLFFPVMMIVVIYYRLKIHPVTFKQRMVFGKLTSILQKSLAGIQSVQGFGNEKVEANKFKDINKEYNDLSWNVAKLSSFTQPMLDFIWSFARLALIGFAGYLLMGPIGGWLVGTAITVDQLVAFIPALDMFLWPITFLSWMGGEFGRIQAGFGRLKRIWDEPIDIVERPDATPLPPLNGDITYDHVTFGYDPAKPVLKDISLRIPAGATVAFLGATGSGKSTLIHLLTRAYDVQAGRILLDGKYDLREIRLDTYLPQVGIVAQNPFLFQQSFKDNLAVGVDNVNIEDVMDACKNADIHGFIAGREQQYDAVIGERGVNLSGGQKQRVTLARALIRHPRILILDAATSSVDVDTEYTILMNLKRIFGKCTTIIITQRLSTVRNADHIYVIDKGEIREDGTHADLIRKHGMYTQLYKTISGESPDG